MGAFGKMLQSYFGGTKHDVSTWDKKTKLDNEEEDEDFFAHIKNEVKKDNSLIQDILRADFKTEKVWEEFLIFKRKFEEWLKLEPERKHKTEVQKVYVNCIDLINEEKYIELKKYMETFNSPDIDINKLFMVIQAVREEDNKNILEIKEKLLNLYNSLIDNILIA